MESREVLRRRRKVRHDTDHRHPAPQDSTSIEERRPRERAVVHRGRW